MRCRSGGVSGRGRRRRTQGIHSSVEIGFGADQQTDAEWSVGFDFGFDFGVFGRLAPSKAAADQNKKTISVFNQLITLRSNSQLTCDAT